MNRQRKVVITVTYNEFGVIVDTKAEELDLSAQPEVTEEAVKDYCRKRCLTILTNDHFHELTSVQPEQQKARIFQGIVVEYPSLITYPEYEGKPYFSIKYTEDGQDFIGYGTYKPDVLSEYLKEYFIPSAQPMRKRGKWIIEKDATGATYGRCSVCGIKQYGGHMNFCYECGADMREGGTR